MAEYNPRRSRPRPVVDSDTDDDPEAAPVEALFGPEPEAPVTPAPSVASNGTSAPPGAPSPTSAPPRPVPAPRSSAPSPLWQIAPLLALLGSVGVLVWWLTRRRNR